MQHVATRVPDETHAEIRRIQDVNECSQSEAIRELLRRGLEYERLQREREAARNQLATLAGKENEHSDLVEYVESEKDLQERERERRDAPAWTRLKYWLFGRSTD